MIDRQALFSGTEAPPPHLALDLIRLAAWLGDRLDGIGPSLEAEKFKGGQSNPTYLLTGAEQSYVLRRRPPGRLIKSAHAIDREYRVLAALSSAGFPVPRPYLYCDDEDVIGSQFYIAEHVAGRVFWEATLPDVASVERGLIYDGMNTTLAALHDLDPAAIGLADFGRAGGYAARNLARWAGVYRESQLLDIADMDWLIDALPATLPTRETVALIHGDYGLYNIIVDPAQPSPRAVLDWEMATLGEPLIDLAHHLRAWWEPPETGGAATTLVGADLDTLGIPDPQAYVDAYCARRAIAVPDMRWYLAFAQFRYAAMIQGILKRARDGTSSSRNVLHRQQRVAEIAGLARRTLERSPK